MQCAEIKLLLEPHFRNAEIEVSSDGYHFDVLIVSDIFQGLTPVRKQQLVYAAINDKITDGSLHAVNMKLFTPAQWASKKSQS